MPDRPWQYDSLKKVLQHMDADVRIATSLRIPSIRCADKVVPLKIRGLLVGDGWTTVNDTAYELGVLRHYPDGNAPMPIQEEEWTPYCDFDEHGFQVTTGHDVLLPGDVSFQKEDHKARYDTEEDEREYRDRLRILRKAERIYNRMIQKGANREFFKRLEPVPEDDEEEVEVRYALLNAFHNPDWLYWQIDEHKVKLLPFNCRRGNKKPPFNCYIQFITKKSGFKQTKYFEYNKKLFEASKHLHEVLFGGRKMPIRVGEFEVSSQSDGSIHRLPIGFRINARKANLEQRTVNHKNLPSILENAENMEILKTDYNGIFDLADNTTYDNVKPPSSPRIVMPVCEVKLKFEGCEDVITLKDQEVVKKCPCLQRSIEGFNADWETVDTVLEEAIGLPFSKTAGDFLFTYIRKYTPPGETDFDTKPEDYPEANAKTLEELKDIIELSNYLECIDFMHCVGFVIAKKLETLTIEEIAAYFGVPCNSKASIFDEADGWKEVDPKIFEN